MAEISFSTFLQRYYNAVGPNAKSDPEIEKLLKADDRYDFLSTDYFNPVYSSKVTLEALTRTTSIYRVLPKTTYMQEGDSMHYISADPTVLEAFLGNETAMFGADTNIPTINDLDHLWPAVYMTGWEDTRVAVEMSKFQAPPVTGPQFLREYMRDFYWNKVDQQLAGVYLSATVHGVDTPSTSTNATIECIDRMISDSTESGAATHVSAATDGDIYWNATNTGTAKIDRSAVTWANAQVKLPAAAGTEDAYNILDELDDLMATALSYAPTAERNYIGMCSPKALNKIQDELDPKMRFFATPEGQTTITQTLGGVSTRPGAMGGKFSVAGLMISGVKVPFFTSPYFSGQASPWVWENTVYTTGGVGNIYLINLDNIEIRHLIPYTEIDYPNYGDWVLGDRHVLVSAMTLLAKNFASHAALKYIAA
jgi:hypothetical protein